MQKIKKSKIFTRLWPIIKTVGPKLVPFFKTVAVFFVLYPTQTPSNLLFLLFKCAPIAALCLFVILHGMNLGFEYSYSRRILIGLIFSMVGDAFLVYKSQDEKYFLFGMAAFAIAHIIYFTAFGLRPFRFQIGLMLFLATVPINLAYLHLIDDNILKIMVPVYVILITSMLWRAISRLKLIDDFHWTQLCCLVGAILFAISDFILAFDRFIYKISISHQLIMSTYYAAQLGIALSIVDSNENHEVNLRVIQHHDVFNVIYKVHSRFVLFSTKKQSEVIIHENKEVIESANGDIKIEETVQQITFIDSKKFD